MGLGDWMIKKTAKSTANSMSKYVKSGRFGDEISSLKAWATTRKDSNRMVSIIDMLFEKGVSPHLIGHTLFNLEMGINDDSLKPSVSQDISEIFKDAFN